MYLRARFHTQVASTPNPTSAPGNQELEREPV